MLYVAPTGSGKTVLFTYIASELARRGRRAWILVHRQELLAQTSKALSAFDVPHGLISPLYTPDPRAALQVASVQTLVRRLDTLDAPDLIICDEAHHAVSPSWRQILDAHPSVKVLGTTATPARLDGKGLGDLFNHMVVGPSVKKLTDLGYLAPAVCYAPPQLLDMTGVPKRAGDYAKEQMAERVDTPTITGDSVAHYSRICPGAPAIAFCVSVAHAEHVAEQFRAAGYRSVSVDGRTDDQQRRAAIQGLATGTVQVLTSCELVSEGLDLPAVKTAILLRPTHSLALARQQIGRALRPEPGKRAIILDHVGNLLRHGLPTDEIEWSLSGGVPKRRAPGEPAPPVRQCPRCYRAYEAWRTACPECGHAPAPKPRTVKEIEGELVEMKATQAKRAADEVKRARTLAELQAIEKARGYRPGWALHRHAAATKLRQRWAR